MVNGVHKLLQLFKDYLSSLPIFIISFYFVTAQPSSHFVLTLNPLNLLLLFSYLLTYPVALHWLPALHDDSLYMQSYVTRGIGNDPRHTILHDRLKFRDDVTNMIVIWALHGILFILSIPIVIVIGSTRIIKHLIHSR